MKRFLAYHIVLFLGYIVFFSTERYELIAKKTSHLRIVWSCSWSPDDVLFATGSRDKTIKIWKTSDDPQQLLDIHFSDSVTAVAFAPIMIANQR
jgi:WD40 repeat protein